MTTYNLNHEQVMRVNNILSASDFVHSVHMEASGSDVLVDGLFDIEEISELINLLQKVEMIIEGD